jgi:hypothetical protein
LFGGFEQCLLQHFQCNLWLAIFGNPYRSTIALAKIGFPKHFGDTFMTARF